MTVAEKYLSYSVPPVISSNSFTTEFIEFQPQGAQRDFVAGSSFSISLANLNKAQFAIPDSCFLTFDVAVLCAAGSANIGANARGIYQTLDRVPRPRWGCPFYSSATVSVPGSSDFSALPSSAQETAQYFYSTRLLASSTSAQAPHDRGTSFSLGGRYNYAGGKSGLQRAECISGLVRYANTTDGTPTTTSIRGQPLSYAVPLSAFATCFSKASALLPLGYFSSGGESLVFNFTVASDIDSVLGANNDGSAEAKSVFGASTFRILNPRIVCSLVRVQDPAIVSQISNLYDGRLKLQMAPPTAGAPPLQVSIPMVIAHKSYLHATSYVPAQVGAVLNSSAQMALTFSGVNQPSVSAVVLRMRYRPSSSLASRSRRQCSSVYLGADEPPVVLKGLQIRLNDQLIPLKGISDEGVSTIPVFSTTGTAPTPANGATLVARTSSGLASSLFEQGRHGLSLFMEDDHSTSLADVVYDKDISFARIPYAQVPVVAGSATAVMTVRNTADTGSLTEQDPFHCVGSYKSPIALFVIPLTSFPSLVGDYANSHTTRGWDLRSVSSFTVSAQLQVVDNGGAGVANTDTISELRNSFLSAPMEDIIVDGTLVCDSALRLASGSSDSRYIYTMVSNATVSSM